MYVFLVQRFEKLLFKALYKIKFIVIIINVIVIYGYIEHKQCFILLFTVALK